MKVVRKLKVTVTIVAVAAVLSVPATAVSAMSATSATSGVEAAAVPPTPVITDTLASGLQTPWGLALLPDGSALLSERDTAKIKRVTASGEVTTVGTVGGVSPGGEGGLLGIAVAPTFAEDRLLYAFYSASGDNRIVRMTYTDAGLGQQETIVTGIPRSTVRHNGGRIAFGPDGMLYAGTGDAASPSTAQNPNSLAGKILRVTPTGEPAPGNPSGTRVYTLGHRNPQGLAWDDDGRLWSSELGENTWDELNLIEAGKNYGWPTCEGPCNDGRFVNPKATWRPSEASPSGLAYASNTLWMAGLRGQRLWAIPISGGQVDGDPKAFFTSELGRLRAVARAADGSLWLASNTGSNLYRLELRTPSACDAVDPTFDSYPTLQAGATGAEVKAAQCLLKAAGHPIGDGDPTGEFDAPTGEATKAFQTKVGLEATGTIDAHTWTALLSAGSTPGLSNGSSGDAVKRLQRALTAALGRTVVADGSFGSVTETAVRDYQTARELTVDGVVGSQTWQALQSGR